MTVVVRSILVGFFLGQIFHIEQRVRNLFLTILKKIPQRQEMDIDLFVTVSALFAISGFGWYAVLIESISGDYQLLQTKSVLDFFTAVVFGSILGKRAVIIPIFQMIILFHRDGFFQYFGLWWNINLVRGIENDKSALLTFN